MTCKTCEMLNDSAFKPIHKKSIEFARNYSDISPKELEEILETLSDWNCLNERGKKLKQRFWETFIKE